jgi:ABC-type Fe3+-hydroxamate transport system substrate-binding protein
LDISEVMRLKPDLLVGSVPFAPETVNKILAEPVAFLALNPRSLTDIERDTRTVGRLVGKFAQAEAQIRSVRAAFKTIRKNAHQKIKAAKKKPVVYAEAWPNPRISSPPWVSELIHLAGATPAVAGGEKVSDDQIAAANPQVIILAWTAAGDRADIVATLRNPSWQNVSAVQTGRVFVIRDELLNTPGPPLVEGARELFRAVWRVTETPKHSSTFAQRKARSHRQPC